jgi:hypothetical protein
MWMKYNSYTSFDFVLWCTGRVMVSEIDSIVVDWGFETVGSNQRLDNWYMLLLQSPGRIKKYIAKTDWLGTIVKSLVWPDSLESSIYHNGVDFTNHNATSAVQSNERSCMYYDRASKLLYTSIRRL